MGNRFVGLRVPTNSPKEVVRMRGTEPIIRIDSKEKMELDGVMFTNSEHSCSPSERKGKSLMENS